MRCLTGTLSALCLALGPAFARGGELPAYRPIDAAWAAGEPPEIRWASTWEQTYEDNVARWKKQLDESVRDTRRRRDLLLLRDALLLQAMLEHFRPGDDVRIAAYEQIADRLGEIGFVDRACAYWKKVVDEFPGRLDDAADALHGIAMDCKRPDRAAWLDYAVRRLIALDEAGALGDDHARLIEALRMRVSVSLDRSRTVAAWRDVERLASLAGDEEPWLLAARAALLYRTGRPREAQALMERLGPAVEGASSYRELQAKCVQAAESISEPILPRKMELEIRWDAFHSGVFRPTAEMADDLLAAIVGARGLLARGDGRFVSMWRELCTGLGRQDAALPGELGRLQSAAAGKVPPGSAGEELARATAAFRRRPFADAAQRGLLAAGESSLRRGHAGLALRCFEDLLAVTGDPGLRQAAAAGRGLARAQGGDPNAPPAAAGGPAAATASPEALRQVPLNLPAAAAWAPGQWRDLPDGILASMWYAHGAVTRIDGGVLVCGPNLLARYDAGRSEPTWVRSAHVPSDWLGGFHYDESRELPVPGPARPAVHEGAVYCRWGLSRHDVRPNALAAFDLATGRMLWSSAGQETWRTLDPIGEPAVADGRLIALAVRGDVRVNTPVYLVCLDADDGRTLWQQLLGHQTVRVLGGAGGLHGKRLDLTCYGASVAIRDGAAYASTSLGFVARCDVRDGQVEWVRTYPRADDLDDMSAAVRRAGPPPIVLGGRVVFAPRDRLGAFALDRRTGERVWDSPALPCDDAAVLPDGRLIVHDARHVATVDGRTGRPLWLREVDRDLTAPPKLVGESLLVGTASGLGRFAVDSGVPLGRADWQHGPLYDFAVGADAVVGVGLRSGDHLIGGPESVAAVAAPADSPRGAMVERQRLTRVWPSLYRPEGDAVPGRAFIVSAGVLECVDLADPLKVVWRNLIRPGFLNLVVRDGQVVVAYPQAVVAYDAGSGREKWRLATDWEVDEASFFGAYVFLKDAGDTLNLTALEARTGKVLWRRRMGDLLRQYRSHRIAALGWDGQALNVFVNAIYYYDVDPVVGIVRPSDGQVLRTIPLTQGVHRKYPAMHLADGLCWYFGSDGKVHEITLDGSRAPRTFAAALPNVDTWGEWKIRDIEVHGRWVLARFYSSRYYQWRTYVLDRSDPDYLLELRRRGDVRDGRYYDFSREVLSVVGLTEKKELLRCTVPGAYEHKAHILAYKETPDSIAVASIANRGTYEPTMLRVDRFDPRTGQFQEGEDLPMEYWGDLSHDLYYRRLGQTNARGLWLGERLLVATPYDLRVFGPAPGAPSPPPAVRVAPPADGPVTVDGSLAEWDAGSAWPMAGAAGGRVLACHDDEGLYLAVVCPDRDARPRIGAGQYGGGDFLEISLDTVSDRFRVTVGQGEDARARIDGLLSGAAVEGARAAVAHDPVAGCTTYEIALPLREVVDRRGEWRRMRLAVRAWDDRSPGGPTPVAQLGGGLAWAQVRPDLHATVHLGPLLGRHEQALGAIARDALALPESLEFLREYCRVRHGGMEAQPKLFMDLLKAHASSPVAVRILAMLDQALRVRADDDPTQRVLSAARSAGVADAAGRQYVELTRACLSQWVNVSPEVPRQMVMVRLKDDPKGDGGWDHRAFWGAARPGEGTYGTPGLRRADRRIGPGGHWVELRVPLIWLDMHDKPIWGVSLLLWGNGTFDRTAIVRGGAEQVLLDDDFPPGSRTAGKLAWVAEPVKTGRRALAKTGQTYTDIQQDVVLAEPVTVHLGGHVPAPLELDKPRAVAALKANLPHLAGSEHAWRFFQALLRLDAAEDDHARRIELYREFLKADPNSSHAPDALYALLRHYSSAGERDGKDKLDADIAACRVPKKTAYDFRLRHYSEGTTYVRSWQAIGPFDLPSVPGGQRHPVEASPIDLADQFDGVRGKIGWRLVGSGRTTALDLGRTLGEADKSVAFAVCWARAERPAPAVIEFGASDVGEVRVNGRGVLKHESRSASPRLASAHVVLEAGWNEVLLKITNRRRYCRFYFELVAPDGRGRPEGVEVTTTPPPRP